MKFVGASNMYFLNIVGLGTVQQIPQRQHIRESAGEFIRRCLPSWLCFSCLPSGWRTMASACPSTPAFALTVAFGWDCSILDMLSLILWTHGSYTYFIIDYGNPGSADNLLW